MTSADPIITILAATGPQRSSLLAEELAKVGSLKPQAARKRISRVQPPIRRYPINLLPKNEAFLYLENDRNSDKFWHGLIRDLRATGSIYELAIDGLAARGGIAQRASFNVVSGAPDGHAGQVPIIGVLDKLVETGLVDRREIGELGECVSLNSHIFGASDINRFRARIIAEDVLTDGLREWARKLGMASYNAIDIRSRQSAPRFSTYQWDLCGPSYLAPLVSGTADHRKPGFLVADVFCGSTLDVLHIQYFLRKIRLLKSMQNVVPFLPVLLADAYTKEALRAGRSNGIIMATTRNLFGETVADAMGSLIDTLNRAAATAATNPDRIVSLFHDLKAIEGAAGNLRGALFEMIVGYLVREVEGASIDIGEIVYDPESGKPAEIDVRRVKEKQECWFYECRGRQPANRITRTEVESWLEKVGRIWRHQRAEQRFQGCKFGFELWTTGDFDDDALLLLRAEQQKRTRISLGWRNGSEVREYAKKTSRKAILDTLDQHYFQHPLGDDLVAV